ncbi:MAG TPA: AAA family ATPase [Terriglobales bacterium]|nr:AAA family ATPase [Terriglobales bacterium]
MSNARLLAVLVTDVVGSTETIARLGAKAGEDWRRAHLEVLREALAATGGREIQHTGDGLLAAFEGASQAVGCAKLMQERVRRANRRRDAVAALSVRIGIALGEATEDAEGIHGLVVIEATRLCAAAKGGQILATALVQALCAGHSEHQFVPAGSLELKGLPAPVPSVEVLWESARTSSVPLPAALAEATQLSFVGRAAEREKLSELWRTAQAGERRAALIAGEPGIGKTRLAAELAHSAAVAGATVLFGRSDEDLAAPFQPWLQALGHHAAHADLEALRADVGEAAGAIARLVPELARRLGVAPTAPSPSEPEAERARLFEAIDALLANASQAAPLVVVLDDLHWADKTSLVLLRSLVRSSRPAALLVVGTYRETDLTRTHPLAELLADLRREPRVERVRLGGLGPEDVSALVASRGQQDPPAEFVAALHAETEGNPFFVEEVLRHLVETGALRREDGRWTSDRRIAELGIPEGVREVVGRRLSRLSETANQALGVAAVIGREFDAALIEAAGGPKGDALLDALDEAARVRLIVEAPGGPPGRFAFSHALVRQTLYEEVAALRRARLHWRIGEALEKRHTAAADEQLSAVAQHLYEGAVAGDVARAVDVTLRAAERAVALVAFEEVIALATRALELLDQAGLEEPETRYRAWMLRGMGEMRLLLPAFRSSYEAAIELARQLARPEWRARAVWESTAQLDAEAAADARTRLRITEALAALPSGDGSERCLLLSRLALSWIVRPEEREPFADDALAMARRLGGALDLDRALAAKAQLLQGSPRVAELEAVVREMGPTRSLSAARDLAPYAYPLYLAYLRADRARFVAECSELERVVAAARWQPYILHYYRAGDALAQGRFAEAKQEAAIFRAGATLGVGGGALGFADMVTTARLEEGRLASHLRGIEEFAAAAPPAYRAYRCVAMAVRAALGDEAAARRELEELMADGFAPLWHRAGGWPLALRHFADAAALLEHEAAARALEAELTDYSGLMLVAWNGTHLGGAADRALGQVLAVQGRLDDACRCYERALALEEGFESWALAARTRYWWARALAERGASGDLARALELLDSCLDRTRAFGMAYLAEQAETLRVRLG